MIASSNCVVNCDINLLYCTVLFAAVPPTGIFGGWLTFFVSLAAIGFITALVGDVASTFGCLVGLEKVIEQLCRRDHDY